MHPDLIVWNATTRTWRTVRLHESHEMMRFEPLTPAMNAELERRAAVSAMRFAPPPMESRSAAWQTPLGDWDD